jgi:hypothetical protein
MRYIILVLLNLPVIFIAFTNILTQYKIGKISKRKFKQQVVLWLAILIVLIGSFPLYNQLNGKYILDSSELSLFDIVQTTALIFLFYIVNRQRQKIEQVERTARELNQEISIRLASYQKQDSNKKS